jgi:hypothetical protein
LKQKHSFPFGAYLRIDAAWQQHLLDIGIDPDQFPTYNQPTPSGKTIQMRAYPDDLKKAFHTWLEQVDLAKLGLKDSSKEQA